MVTDFVPASMQLMVLDRIFIIEGAVTAASALCAHFFICNWPENASFLSTEDYILVRKRIANDAGVARMDDLNAKAIARCVGDWKIWLR